MDEKGLKIGDGRVNTVMSVDLSLDELLVKFGRSAFKPTLRAEAEKALVTAREVWSPKLTYRWLNCRRNNKTGLALTCPNTGVEGRVDLGFSVQFVEGAEMTLIGVYTVGQELEGLTKSASVSGLHLDSYIYDMIALGVLEKVKDQVNALVENYALERKWGVSPFLSPGSVHGWKLEDQLNLIELLPIREIGVEKSSSGVLHPFKSLSFLIAVGPGLQQVKVGTSCQVCSRGENCEMRGQT
jgi:hypothetical protein